MILRISSKVKYLSLVLPFFSIIPSNGFLKEVLLVEADDRNWVLTAVPKPGAIALPAISALVMNNQWPVAELHLEAGRLDEVFRSITHASGAAETSP